MTSGGSQAMSIKRGQALAFLSLITSSVQVSPLHQFIHFCVYWSYILTPVTRPVNYRFFSWNAVTDIRTTECISVGDANFTEKNDSIKYVWFSFHSQLLVKGWILTAHSGKILLEIFLRFLLDHDVRLTILLRIASFITGAGRRSKTWVCFCLISFTFTIRFTTMSIEHPGSKNLSSSLLCALHWASTKT